MKKLKIYTCGGAGIDISRHIDIPDVQGFADYDIVHVDTSVANFKATDDAKAQFVVPGVHGTGKDPEEGFKAFLPVMDSFLKEHKPGIFNIVLCSVAGGSGSGIGTALTTELLSRGHPTIIIVIGSIIDQTQTRNTQRMIANLDSRYLLKRAGRSIVMAYFENHNGTDGQQLGHRGTEQQVDSMIVSFIKRIALLVSEHNHRLDRADILNFIQFDLTKSGTEIPHRLVDITVQRDLTKLKPFTNKTISMANLLVSRDVVEPDLGAIYSTTGYYQAEQLAAATTDGKCNLESLSFIITPVLRDARTAWLDEAHNRYVEVTAKLIESSNRVETDDDDDMSF